MSRIAITCALLCATATLRAQSMQVVRQVATAEYALSGTIADADGNPVTNAQIELLENDHVARTTRSDLNGRFRIDALPRASVVIRVRRLGFDPKTLTVQITAADRQGNVFVKLEPHAATLSGMRVEDEDTTDDLPDSRLTGFYDRERTNDFGHYVGPDQIAKLHPQYPSQALREIPGILIKPSRRIGNIVRLRECGVPGESPETTGPLIWIDGVRMPGAELDEAILGSDIAAIEVYNSLAGIPAQYFDRSAVCGTILVWTKSR